MIAEAPRCQLHSPLAEPSLGRWLQGYAATLRRRLRLRTRLRAWRFGPPAEPAQLGAPSRFAAGTWVRIKDAKDIYPTLNGRKQLRGLSWVWQQWPYCGTVHQVFKPVQRMMDDAWTVRPISNTVLLDTVPCSGPLGHLGCGRECPMMFRDEWLEEVPPPPAPLEAAPPVLRHATVRSADAIRQTLDSDGARGGLVFMNEMYRHTGQRFAVQRKVERVLDGNVHVPAAQPVYLLAGLFCSGAAIGADGPCERNCRLLWHEDWLHMED